MEKVYGAEKRRDGIQQTGRRRWEIYYGYGEDDTGGYNWLERVERKPSAEEIRQLITDHLNALTAEEILNGFTWQDKPVYLSRENQLNFKAAYDLATGDADALPLTFKLGETEAGAVVYHTFESLEELKDFYTSAIQHIQRCLARGWAAKDEIDTAAYQ